MFSMSALSFSKTMQNLLTLALLIDRQDNGVVGRIDVETRLAYASPSENPQANRTVRFGPLDGPKRAARRTWAPPNVDHLTEK
jgi:hypothetical protein